MRSRCHPCRLCPAFKRWRSQVVSLHIVLLLRFGVVYWPMPADRFSVSPHLTFGASIIMRPAISPQ